MAGDLRYTLRVLRRSPGFTAVAVLSLAIGIGASTAIFGVVRTLLLTPLPVEAPEELAILAWRTEGNPGVSNMGSTDYPDPRGGQVVLLAGVGLLVGIPGALAAGPLVGSLVYGVAPNDPSTVAFAGLALLTVALGACLLPALRAARTDVSANLRAD